MITAFLLGIMGSLHCAGMCGPLVLMTPVVGSTPSDLLASRATYHAGRLATYAIIGAIFGLVGESIVFAGFQRWLSLIVGTLMILAITVAIPLKARFTRIPLFIKSLFGKFLHERSFKAVFALGATNGLLPCGLVYMAATASVATGRIGQSILYMLLFGLGTMPMLLAISLAGKRLHQWPSLQKLVPLSVLAVAAILIFRAQPLSLLREPSAKATCPACAASQIQ